MERDTRPVVGPLEVEDNQEEREEKKEYMYVSKEKLHVLHSTELC